VRLPAALSVALVAFALVAGACGQPVPPPVAVGEPSVDTGDLAVIRGLIDDHRRRVAPARPHFLVVDTTLASCVNVPPPGACLADSAIEEVSRLLPRARVRTGTLDFESRNARPVPITGSLGTDVSYVSWTLIDFSSRADLLRKLPAGSAVVAFSRPSYPAPRVAVLAYSAFQNVVDAARLVQQADGRWEVDVATLPVWQTGLD